MKLIKNVVQLLTSFFLLSRNENGLQKRNSVNCLQPQFQKEGAKLFPFVSSPLAFLYCLRSHSYVWFQGWTQKAFTSGGKRADLHFHENNLKGNLWNFQAIHKVCTSSSTLKMLVASSEENKDYCKMQIRSNLSEILRCSICSVGGICCNQLDQSALHWETSEFKHILKFSTLVKYPKVSKLQNVAEIIFCRNLSIV